jgi:hypothetical protein
MLEEVSTMTSRLLLLIVGLTCTLTLLAEARVITDTRASIQAPAFVTDNLEGRAPHAQELQPSVEAAFQAESYAPRTVAKLAFFNRSAGVGLQVFRVGAERARTRKNEMRGVPVTSRTVIGSPTARSVVEVRIGDWPSGLYFARLDATDGRLGFAPFVVRPRRLGEHRVAVVMPTFTWQAYNIRDDDKDGASDSWYGDWRTNVVRLYRPYLNRGVPYHFRTYDLPFLHWLEKHEKQVDFLTDSDLDAVGSGSELAGAYDLIVFPGHHEYVTTQEYDVVDGYRNRGGSLMFLSANNFFWRVTRHGNVLERTKRWRDLGRPEAALVGIQYTGNKLAFGRYVVLDATSEPWIFAGTGLRRGSLYGYGGIEIDAISSSSPTNLRLVGRIPNVFGRGQHADMTIYRTKRGGKVFAAGSFTMAGSSDCPDVSRIIENLWASLT